MFSPIIVEKKRKGAHFSPKRSKGAHFCYPHFVRKRLIPQIRVRMQANDDNEDEDGAVEGLVDLGLANPYQGAPIHQEEQFRNSNLVNPPNGKFDQSLLWEPFGTSKAAYATLELESFVNNKVNGIYQLKKGGNQCRVVCRGDVGRIKWNKTLSKFEPTRRNTHVCSYRAHIRKIRKKDHQPHWIIDPKHTELKHNARCLLGTRHCPSNTTVRKRILKDIKEVRLFTDRKTRGKQVASSIQVNAQVKVRDVHAKMAWNAGNGTSPKDFQESFTRMGHVIKHLKSANGRCAAKVGWSEARDEINMLPEEQRGNADIKFFSRYALCARGLRNFETEAGLPYFSFDACHSYHPYYRGTYGNAVALVDTKRESLTNCAFALSTDDSENTRLYTALFIYNKGWRERISAH